jgi:minichromosome maintenance protein 10
MEEATGPSQDGDSLKPPDSSKFESYSSLHLSNRVLPHSFLSRTLADKKVLRIPDLLKTVKAPAFELPEDIEGDFVVFGIVASKSDPRDVKPSGNASTKKTDDPYDDGLNNTNKYMVITLTDLKWTVDLFLFGTAFPRYYKISEGTLIAILNPTIMPPPKHKLDTNRFSLSLSSSDDTVLEIGHARDIGFCKTVRKDGKTCQSWVDGRKTEFCDFHVDIQIRKTQGQRSGVNADTGMFGGGKSGARTGFFSEGAKRGGGQGNGGYGRGQGLKREGPSYDMASQSLYYVAPAPKNRGAGRASYNPITGSAANLIDTYDDPFQASGMMGPRGENKEARLGPRWRCRRRVPTHKDRQ